MGLTRGSIRLFRLLGVDVLLHWSWVIVAVIQVRLNPARFESGWWSLGLYMGLFGIVLLHEMGHALACRSVGGEADEIVLWPLGGVAFVRPPQRAGAVLWAIAAGPLVNVLLLLPTWLLFAHFRGQVGPDGMTTDLAHFTYALMAVNLGLLLFNLLPVFPLDGGQIFRSLLWFVIGPARSLYVAALVGLAGAALGLVVAIFYLNSLWMLVIVFFAGFYSLSALGRAKQQLKMRNGPRHALVRCPNCHEAPPMHLAMRCDRCGRPTDWFEPPIGTCKSCGTPHPSLLCPFCYEATPPAFWSPGHAPPGTEVPYIRPQVALETPGVRD